MKYRFAIVLTILISSKVLGQRIEKEFFASTSNCLLTKHRLNVISTRENFFVSEALNKSTKNDGLQLEGDIKIHYLEVNEMESIWK